MVLEGDRMASSSSKLTCARMRLWLKLRTWMLCGYRYAAELDPYRVLWIDPALVRTSADLKKFHSLKLANRVLDGNWDQASSPFESRSISRMLADHFKRGTPWADTEVYQEIIQKIAVTGIYWNDCTSEEDVRERCAYLDDLFENIKTHGYRVPPGLEYGKTGLVQTCFPEEVAVNVGRSGEFLFWDGRHRLMMAKILKLALIPVRVVIRHHLWQETRDSFVKARRKQLLPPELSALASHPDISYL